MLTRTLPAFFLMIAIIGCVKQQSTGLTYANLITEVEAGNVKSAELTSDSATVILKTPPRVAPTTPVRKFRVMLPPVTSELDRFTDLLARNDVAFSVKE